MKKSPKTLAIVVGCMILADIAGGFLKFSRAETNSAILTVLVFGAVLLASEELWKKRSYWGLLLGFLCLHTAGLWVAFHFKFWGSDFKGWFFIGILELWCFDRGIRFIHRRETRSPQEATTARS